MPTPIVQVDVDDARFKQFKELFDRHRQHVDDLAKQWSNVGQTAGDAAEQASQTTDAATEAGQATEGHVQATERLLAATQDVTMAWGALSLTVKGFDDDLAKAAKRVEALGAGVRRAGSDQDDLTRKARASEGIFAKLADHTRHVSRSVKDATASLLKWSEIGAAVSLLGGFAGSLFGFDRLSVAAGNMQRSAAGLGVTPGEQSAFRINYQRFVDADTVLANVTEARSDYTKRAALLQMGFTNDQINRDDPAQIAVEATRRARERFANSDRSVQFAQATGLAQIFSMADLRRLVSEPREGVERAQTNFNRDAIQLNVSQSTLRQFQNFNQQLSRAGSLMETALIRRLVTLTGPLDNLSQSVVRLFEDIVNNPHIGEWLNDLSLGLTRFTKYLDSPELETDIKKFFDQVAQLTTTTERFLKGIYTFGDGIENSWLFKYFTGQKTPGDALLDELNKLAGHGGGKIPGLDALREWLTRKFTPETNLPEDKKVAASVAGFERLGYSPEASAALTATQVGESGLDPNAINKTSGAWGLNQLLGNEKKVYDDWAIRHGFDPMTTSPEEQREFIADRLKTAYPDVEHVLQDTHATVVEKVNAMNRYERFAGFDDPNNAEVRRRDLLASKVYTQVINDPALSKVNAGSNDDLPLVLQRLRSQQQRQEQRDAPAISRPPDHYHDDQRAIKLLAKHLRRASAHRVTINVNNPAGANVTLASSQAAAQ